MTCGPAARLARRTWPILMLLCLALLFSACAKMARISGMAMSPTINDGELVAIGPVAQTLRRGEIVVFRFPLDPSKSFLKRIIGLPGETVTLVDGVVAVNGKPLGEPYVIEENRSHDSFGPVRVPQREYFVLGDNRRNSSDSRHWGCVPASSIWGTMLLPRHRATAPNQH
jgi:signal peptidase I